MTTNNDKTVLVTGGNGRTGSRVAQRLRELGHTVRIGSRSAGLPFDWERPQTWPAVLTGVDAVYLCFAPDLALPGADAVITAFTEAATAAGVNRIVLLSGRGEPAAKRCEDAVLAGARAGVVVSCAWFAQNFSENFLVPAVAAGHIALPVGPVAEPFVDLDDVADVAVRALTTDHYDGRVLELTGPELLTFAQAAAELTAATGRPVRFTTITADRFVAELTGEGVPAEDADFLAWLFTETLDGRNAHTTDTIAEVLGRPAKRFGAVVRAAAETGVWTAA